MQADDDELAARLAIGLAQPTLNSGRQETARRWFGWFDDRRRRGSRTALPRAGHAPVLAERRRRADRTAGRGSDSLAPRARKASMPASWPSAGSASCATASTRALRDGELAVASLPPDDPLAVAALAGLGIAQVLAGQANDAESTLGAALDALGVRAHGQPRWRRGVHPPGLPGASRRGDRVAAEAYVRRARTTLVDNTLTEHPMAAAIDALDARLAMARARSSRRGGASPTRSGCGPRPASPRRGWPCACGSTSSASCWPWTMAAAPGPMLAEIHDLLRQRPDLGTLVDETRELADPGARRSAAGPLARAA